MVNDPRFRKRVPPVEGYRVPGVDSGVPAVELPAERASFELSGSPSDFGRLSALLLEAISNREIDSTGITFEDLEEISIRRPGMIAAIDGYALTLDEVIIRAARQEDPSRQLVQSVNQRLVDLVNQDPKSLLEIPGHLFEDLFADVLSDLGFDSLSLRVMTNLGEADILGFTRDILGQRIGYIFELKQLGRSGRRVELSEITRLYGLRDGLRQRLGISQGVFVTTTDFTAPAKQAGEIYDLNLKNYENLVQWVRSCYSVSAFKGSIGQ
jgi:hypothetical protein